MHQKTVQTKYVGIIFVSYSNILLRRTTLQPTFQKRELAYFKKNQWLWAELFVQYRRSYIGQTRKYFKHTTHKQKFLRRCINICKYIDGYTKRNITIRTETDWHNAGSPFRNLPYTIPIITYLPLILCSRESSLLLNFYSVNSVCANYRHLSFTYPLGVSFKPTRWHFLHKWQRTPSCRINGCTRASVHHYHTLVFTKSETRNRIKG